MFLVQKLFHLTQVIDDLDAADRWYNKVFSPCRYYRAYMKEAMRDASLLVIGDATLIEPVQLAREPGAESSPLGKFKQKFGSRLHSIAWYVDDLDNAVEDLLSHGVRMTDVTGRPVTSREDAGKVKYVWTHPRDSHGPLEFARLSREFTTDPRHQAHWSAAYWRDQHPLGIDGRLGITMVVRETGAAATFYEKVLGAKETEALAADGRRSFEVGSDTLVELVPTTAEEVAGFGDGVFGMTFHVRDLDRARRFLSEISVPARRLDDLTLRIAPADALGATVSFRQLAEA